MSRLNTVLVMFSNDIYNYTTSVSAHSTFESSNEYFTGKYFNVCTYPVENMQQCIGIEFYEPFTIGHIYRHYNGVTVKCTKDKGMLFEGIVSDKTLKYGNGEVCLFLKKSDFQKKSKVK